MNYQELEKMFNWENVDVEKVVFEMIEQRAPVIAEKLLEMACRPTSLSDLLVQLQVMVFEDELNEDDYESAVIALRYARRYLADPIRSH